MSEMLVSVIIPAYNVEKYIARCLDSVCGQTYGNLEIIVVNDGSTDNTASIIKTYAEKDKRIRFVNLSTNMGNGKGRNLAIKEATGEYLYFVDSDDFISSDMTECLVNKVNQTSFPDVVLFGHQKMKEKGTRLKKMGDPTLPNLNGEETLTQLQTCCFFGYKGISAQPWLYFINRKYILDNDIYFDDSGHYFEDMIFSTKLIFNVKHIEQIRKPFYTYILRKGSIMSNRSKKRIESWIYVTKQIRNFLKEKNLFEQFKDAYTVSFVNCAFLVPFYDFIEMKDLDAEIEQFLLDMSKTDVVKYFHKTALNIPTVDGLTKKERSVLKRMKQTSFLLSSNFKLAKTMFRLGVRMRRFIWGE